MLAGYMERLALYVGQKTGGGFSIKLGGGGGAAVPPSLFVEPLLNVNELIFCPWSFSNGTMQEFLSNDIFCPQHFKTKLWSKLIKTQYWVIVYIKVDSK